ADPARLPGPDRIGLGRRLSPLQDSRLRPLSRKSLSPGAKRGGKVPARRSSSGAGEVGGKAKAASQLAPYPALTTTPPPPAGDPFPHSVGDKAQGAADPPPNTHYQTRPPKNRAEAVGRPAPVRGTAPNEQEDALPAGSGRRSRPRSRPTRNRAEAVGRPAPVRGTAPNKQ